MGGGIVQTFLESGYRVVLKEIDKTAAESSRDKVITGLERRARKGGLPQGVDEAAARLNVTTAYPTEIAPALVVESVPESLAIKAAVLGEVSTGYPHAIIGTNTSGLSINELAAYVNGKSRFVGLHFFNPVPLSSLVEIVRGSATSPETIAACHEFSRRIDKEAIEVRDSPGFATSRLGIAIGLEAMRMVEQGVASADDIDLGMVKGYRFPIGPLALSDMVGLDVRLAIADHLQQELGDRFRAPDILRDLVDRGNLGVKSGQGFYTWDPSGRRSDAN